MQKSSVELVGQERGWQGRRHVHVAGRNYARRCPDGLSIANTQTRIANTQTRRGNRPGAKERLENLKWAREHCDGLVRVVVMRAKDTKEDPRSIAECFPHDKLVMRIIHIDEATGEFRAESA
jgi:hypothetical protein